MTFSVSGHELWLISPLIILFLTSLVPITIKVFNGNKEQPASATFIEVCAGILIAMGVVYFQWDNVEEFKFFETIVFDGLSSWTNILTLLVGLGTLFLSFRNAATRGEQFSEHVFLVLNAMIGMFVMTWANDLIVIFIGMEIMSLALYVLIGISHEQKLSKEAAFKYFILGSLASAIYLYGTALIFGSTDSTSILRLMEVGPGLMATNRIFLLGFVMMLSGIAFKVALFPFHAWTPDVYQGSPTPITAFMATGVKLSMFAVLMRIVSTQGLFTVGDTIPALQLVAVLTMVMGNFAAIFQNNFKRMLAYSSIAHSGYLMVGIIAICISNKGTAGASGVLFYLAAYSVMNMGAFAVVCLFEARENSALLVDDLKGLSKRNPLLALCLTICLLSLAGIPPTVGFFGKFYLFSSAVKEGLIWLVVWGVINSVVSVYYYLRPVVNMYMYDLENAEQPLREFYAKTVLFVSVIFIVVMGLVSSPLYEKAVSSVEALFN